MCVRDQFTHILQRYFTGIGTIIVSAVIRSDMGKLDPFQTTTKANRKQMSWETMQTQTLQPLQNIQVYYQSHADHSGTYDCGI